MTRDTVWIICQFCGNKVSATRNKQTNWLRIRAHYSEPHRRVPVINNMGLNWAQTVRPARKRCDGSRRIVNEESYE